MYSEYLAGSRAGKTYKSLRSFLKTRREENAKIKRYVSLSESELASLSDEELYKAMDVRLDQRVGAMEITEALSKLNMDEKVFYVLNLFDMEVQNGGLCQFYVGLSSESAPLVAEYLHTVGAEPYVKLFEGFNKKNGIDVNNLSSFYISDADEFEEQKKRYDFDAFDEVYYSLYEDEPLNEKVVRYLRRIL